MPPEESTVNESESKAFPALRRILVPTDFSPASEVAFAHALRIALAARCVLEVVHFSNHPDKVEWSSFPRVRATLERWALMKKESTQDDVLSELGVAVNKAVMPGRDTARGVLRHLEQHPADMIVLAAIHRHGIGGLAHGNVAGPIAKKSGEISLFVPDGTPGFVSVENGAVTLKNILVPVDHERSAHAAIEAACRGASWLGCRDTAFTVLYAGKEDRSPEIEVPVEAGWTWEKRAVPGDPVKAILDTARSTRADLIVMSTAGHPGLLGALRGNVTGRIAREAPCPVFAIPGHGA